ncbi:spore coat protein [Oceanobacillus jordanicus]|uniref:Spore coat protein n=1 Tax=Oceanobacillus jordanicus TaxID=2867266 RepID=A0AAW5B272_9BACI|nr:spore coat protein [Oceanobacillus jordanicus]MCG3417734.1 spore coat protein [Oceanobacillus jordanicus]
MQLASHELNELSELIAGCFNTVTCMSSFINQAQDPELKEMLQRHFPLHVADYNLKVEFVQSATTPDINKFQPAELLPKLDSYTKAPVSQFPSSAPRTDVQKHTDREIALAYLLGQKASAKNYAAATVECANPDLRTFLEKAFLNSSHHAYEAWEYMTKNGYYPLMPAPPEAIQAIAGMYQPVQHQ